MAHMKHSIAADFVGVEDTLDKAGLTITDLAALTPFSRSTLYNWRTGLKSPSTFYKATFNGYIDLIDKAIANNRLPLTSILRGKERIATLRAVLREVKRLKD